MRTYDPVAIARQYLYLRELPGNHGLRVEAVQHWSGGEGGDAWCVEFGWMVFDICYQGHCPWPRMQNSQVFLDFAAKHGWIVKVPHAGDVCLSINDAGIAHHWAIVTEVLPLTTIAGNTSEDGVSVNGDRVAEHRVSTRNKVFVRVPIHAAEEA